MRKPDFFIVGAAKCGTTAMNDYLGQHPEIFVPQAKEIHYFGQDLDIRTARPRDTLESYLARFEGAQDFARAGEASVWYIYSRSAAQEIKDFEPDASIIIMLRDPVEFMYSQHSQAMHNALGDEDILDFAEALAAEEDRVAGRRPVPPQTTFPDGVYYRRIARFTEQVQRYYDLFPRERIHVIVFDDFKADTLGCVQDTYRFLGVDPGFEPETPVVNPNKTYRSWALRRLQQRIPGKAKGLVPAPLRQRASEAIYALNRSYQPRAKLDPQLRAALEREFAPEVAALGELIGRDLSHWSKG
jgi:hypothetical protein